MGHDGRGGSENTASQYAPIRVDSLRFEYVTALSPGALHMLAVTQSGDRLVGFGDRSRALGSTCRRCRIEPTLDLFRQQPCIYSAG